MSPPQWLKNYYGKDFDSLTPALVIDGKRFAVVRIRSSKTSDVGHSRTGYVLIKKSGRHSASPHQSLHEGVVTDADMARMKKVLEKEDGA